MIFRIRFAKYGAVRFIGHLDVMRYFQKAVRRSGLQIRYSQGYNPHQLMVFAQPLGVGITSDGEYMDIEVEDTAPECESTFKYVTDAKTGNGEKMEYVLSRSLLAGKDEEVARDMKIASDRVVETLKKGLTEGFEILSCRVIPWIEGERHPENAMSLVNGADYLISLRDGYSLGIEPEELKSKFTEFLSRKEIVVIKKTKSGEAEIDIKPHILEAVLSTDNTESLPVDEKGISHAEIFEPGIRFFLRLSAGSSINIKPDLVLNAFFEACGISPEPSAFRIHRAEMYRDVKTKTGL